MGGLEALEKALSLRMYALINDQHTEWGLQRRTLRFYMDRCRVHAARERKRLPRFPCKAIGENEFPPSPPPSIPALRPAACVARRTRRRASTAAGSSPSRIEPDRRPRARFL
jgi:hypothetical protein